MFEWGVESSPFFHIDIIDTFSPYVAYYFGTSRQLLVQLELHHISSVWCSRCGMPDKATAPRERPLRNVEQFPRLCHMMSEHYRQRKHRHSTVRFPLDYLWIILQQEAGDGPRLNN